MTICPFCDCINVSVILDEDLPVCNHAPESMKKHIYHECEDCGRGWIQLQVREVNMITVSQPKTRACSTGKCCL